MNCLERATKDSDNEASGSGETWFGEDKGLESFFNSLLGRRRLWFLCLGWPVSTA